MGHGQPCPSTPRAPTQRGGCLQTEVSPYLWSVELQIWEFLPFQVSIAQETAVLKGTS